MNNDNAAPQQAGASPQMVCNLAHADAFTERYFTPHVPILTAFGDKNLHTCRLTGEWDLDRAISDHGCNLLRSIRKLESTKGDPTSSEWDDLTFQFGPHRFVYLDPNRIVGFGTSAHEAEELVAEFSTKYRKPVKATGGIFHLIRDDSNDISCQAVTLPASTTLSVESLNRHYPGGTTLWHKDFSQKLCDRSYGLSVFEGKPGTGKTSYLRHLIGVLKESHRFYFIPTSSLSILSRPKFIGFWAEQRRVHGDQKFVVILEDSDAALMTRGADNREQVSAILNISDGMLADFLRLQIICTINCSAADIDPALLRPGRLLCHRTFRLLNYDEAAQLAESLGKPLPERRDYSLAEVFVDCEVGELNRPRIGFAAS